MDNPLPVPLSYTDTAALLAIGAGVGAVCSHAYYRLKRRRDGSVSSLTLTPSGVAFGDTPPTKEDLDKAFARTTENMKEWTQGIKHTAERADNRMERLEGLLTAGGGTAKGQFGERLTGFTIRKVIPEQLLYEQYELRSGRRIDFAVDLPGWRLIGIESKFTSPNAQYVRQRVKECTKYLDDEELESFIIMCVPHEGVLSKVYTDFPDVVRDASRVGVFIMSLSGLAAFLNACRVLIRKQEIAEQADEIVQQIHSTTDEFKDLAAVLVQNASDLKEAEKLQRQAVQRLSGGITGIHGVQQRATTLAQRLHKLWD